jgi:hypothetical protein
MSTRIGVAHELQRAATELQRAPATLRAVGRAGRPKFEGKDHTMKRIRSIISRNAIALIALFFALSGAAVAGPLITGANIQDESVTGADILNGSLTSVDVAKAADADKLGGQAASAYLLKTPSMASVAAKSFKGAFAAMVAPTYCQTFNFTGLPANGLVLGFASSGVELVSIPARADSGGKAAAKACNYSKVFQPALVDWYVFNP